MIRGAGVQLGALLRLWDRQFGDRLFGDRLFGDWLLGLQKVRTLATILLLRQKNFIFMKNKNFFLTINLFNGYIAGLYKKPESKDEAL